MSDKLSQEEMIQKAIDTGTLPSAELNRQQSERFIDLVIDYSVLLKQVRSERKDHPKGEVNKLDLGNIVTEDASISPANTKEPSASTVEYDMEKYRAAFDVTSDFFEDNIEGPAVRDKLLDMFTKRIAIDTEIAFIEGDENISTGGGSAEDNLLGLNDGILTIGESRIPASQNIDAEGAATSKKLFYDMKRKIPSRFRVAKPSYRWIVPSVVSDKWNLDVSERETAQGDRALTSNQTKSPFGIPMTEVPLMPEDLSYGTAVDDASKLLLTPLQNLLYFIQRRINIEWDRVPREDKWEVTVHFRCDFQIENADMCVQAKNVSESGSDYS